MFKSDVKRQQTYINYHCNSCLKYKYFVTEPELNFAKKLEDQTITEGSVATLSCEVSKDNAAVVWCKDGADIKPNEKYSVVKKDKQCSLIINNVTTEDGGEYIAKIGEKQMSAAVIKVEGDRF